MAPWTLGRGLGLAALLLLIGAGPGRAQTKADSGWVPLFNGQDFANLYFHFHNVGVVEQDQQNAFTLDSGMIHVPKAVPGTLSASQGHIMTRKEYSWYRVRVEYRFAANQPAGSQNAGLLVHVDNDAALIANTKERRPRSIEINMRRVDGSPWTLWSAGNLGPYISTTVKAGTQQYLAQAEGGVPWTNNPWAGDRRIVFSSYANPEKPMGQWNLGEARIYGDSLGEFYLNGVLRVRGWDFKLRATAADSLNRVPCGSGGIGLQSEDHEIWYRNWEIMELEPHTLRPLHAKPTSVKARGAKRAPLRLGAATHRLDGRQVRVP